MTRARIEIFEADEPLLVGRITFVVDRDVAWRFTCGPHGDHVDTGPSIRELAPVANRWPKMEDYLPEGWTYAEFMAAWHSWADGHRKGLDLGAHQERERQAGRAA